MTRPLPKPIAMLLVALVVVRVASITWSATGRTGGDFYASMPGAYVETLNPDLWNSPDLGSLAPTAICSGNLWFFDGAY